MTGYRIESPSWTRKYMQRAILESTWSKDPSSMVGAVIADADARPVSSGYNGLPQGVHDDPALLGARADKYETVIHAEENAMLFADRSLCEPGMTLFTYPLPPCSRCTARIRQAGIRRIVSPDPRTHKEFDRLQESCRLDLAAMLRDTAVDWRHVDLNELGLVDFAKFLGNYPFKC